MERLAVIFLASLFLSPAFAQIDSLSQEELAAWSLNLKDRFFDFDNYMINLLDRNGLEQDRRISEVKAVYLFAPKARIIDYFPDNKKEAHNRETYVERIAGGVKKRYVLSRQRKIIGIDDFVIKQGTAVLDNDFSKQSRRYEAIVSFHEKLIYSDEVDPKDSSGDPGFIEELHSLKKMRFVLKKTEDPSVGYFYDLYCDGLDIVDPEMGDYLRLKDSLKMNGSNQLFQELIAQENDESRTNLTLDIMTPDEQDVFNKKEKEGAFITDLRDTLQVTKPVKFGLSDYLFIGKGHLKKGASEYSKTLGIIYGVGVLTGASLASYFKVKSRAAYKDHLNSNTITEIDHNYKIANDNHHNFLYALGGATVLAITSTIHLKLKSKRNTNRYNSILEQNEKIKSQNERLDLQLHGYLDTSNSGISLRYNF